MPSSRLQCRQRLRVKEIVYSTTELLVTIDKMTSQIDALQKDELYERYALINMSRTSSIIFLARYLERMFLLEKRIFIVFPALITIQLNDRNGKLTFTILSFGWNRECFREYSSEYSLEIEEISRSNMCSILSGIQYYSAVFFSNRNARWMSDSVNIWVIKKEETVLSLSVTSVEISHSHETISKNSESLSVRNSSKKSECEKSQNASLNHFYSR